MNMPSIRRATLDDAMGISRVHVHSWRETYRGIVSDDVLTNLSVERRLMQWQASLSDPQDPYHDVFVGERDQEIVGFANYGRGLEKDPDYPGELFAIYILQSAQREGLGRALVTSVARDLLEHGIASMLVWVLEQNPARGFYEHLSGVYLRAKPIEIGSAALTEVAYGWRDIRKLVPDAD